MQASGDTQDTSRPSLLELVASLASDQTGSSTFERYRWQAKQVVRQWLTCLDEDGTAEFVICEHVEDIAVVYPGAVRFLQLKTRDRGSWSTSSMCSSGLNSLVRSYNELRTTELYTQAKFELWLEGPIADANETVAFVQSPGSASSAVQRRLAGLGLKRAHTDDFLSRLSVHPDQPTRTHIDGKIVYELGALWPSISKLELEIVYEKLLAVATAAQAATEQTPLVRAMNSARTSRSNSSTGESDRSILISNQILGRELLTALTPPLPGEAGESLIARIASGQGASLLELKLRAAGATPATIETIQEMRAEMEVERQLLLAGGDQSARDLDLLASRLLTMARATASRLALSMAVSPAAAARPAEAITAELLSHPAELAHVDRKKIFHTDERLIFGFLGHLSDECLFGWRA